MLRIQEYTWSEVDFIFLFIQLAILNIYHMPATNLGVLNPQANQQNRHLLSRCQPPTEGRVGKHTQNHAKHKNDSILEYLKM